MSSAVRQALVWWVDVLAARALTVVLGAALLTALGLTYALPHLRVDTSTEEMISADVPFRQNRIAFTRAFPDLLDPIVAVIEGATPEQVDQAAGALADALRADSKRFTAVDYSANDPFFATHGLLYLGLDQLTALTDRLAGAQPLLAALAEDPSLRGLAAFVELALQQQGPGEALPAELDRLLADMATAVEAQLTGAPGMLSWRQVMQDGISTAPSRALVVAEPRLDHASFAPAAAAIDALRAHASAVGIDAGRGLRLGITGKAALDDEELQSVTSGALLAGILSTFAVTALLVWGLRSLRLIAATLITLTVGLILDRGGGSADHRPAQSDFGDLRGAVRRSRGRFRHPSGPSLPGGARSRGIASFRAPICRGRGRRRPLAERALRRAGLSRFRADGLSGARRTRADLGERDGDCLSDQPQPAAGAAPVDAVAATAATSDGKSRTRAACCTIPEAWSRSLRWGRSPRSSPCLTCHSISTR